MQLRTEKAKLNSFGHSWHKENPLLSFFFYDLEEFRAKSKTLTPSIAETILMSRYFKQKHFAICQSKNIITMGA